MEWNNVTIISELIDRTQINFELFEKKNANEKNL